MIENIKYHLIECKWIYLLIILMLVVIGVFIFYEYNYPCVYGHTESIWQQTYIYNSDGTYIPIGGYYQDIFICDCRTIRDSIK